MNKASTKLLKSIAADLERESFLPHHAATVGCALLAARVVHAIPDTLTAALFSRFWRRIDDAGLTDLLASRMKYALRLASSGALLSEEGHKLSSLCEETDALAALGFTAPQELEQAFDSAVRLSITGDEK